MPAPSQSGETPDLVPHLKAELRKKLQTGAPRAVEEFLESNLSLSPGLLLEVIEAELAAHKTPAELATALKRYRALAEEIGQNRTRSMPATAVTSGEPKAIGRFVILAKLGEGAFGQVYRARDPQLDREVALKVPKRNAFASDAERERFLREARAAGALQHPNICPVHEVIDSDNGPCIVMAYVPGKSLAEYLRGRTTPLTPRQAAVIVRRLALALQAAHAKGIVHRDLKPANILFDDERKDVVITDFGLARRVAPNEAELTREGDVLGTPAYMSPEQARGEVQAIGPATDIYGLGVILYELLTGERPFRGKLPELLAKVKSVAPKPPAQVKPGIDAKLDAICVRALAKKPIERFASMKEMAQALGDFLKAAPDGSFSTKPQNSSETSQLADAIAALAQERKADTKARRGLVGWLAAGLGCVSVSVCFTGVALAVAIFLFTRVGPGEVDADGKPIDKGGNLISVKITNLTYINNQSVHYYLDGKKIDAAKLKDAIALREGLHEIVAKRGNEVLEQREIRVAPEHQGKEIVAFVPEGNRDVGEIWTIAEPDRVAGRGVTVSPQGDWVLGAWSTKKDHYLTLWSVDDRKKLFEREKLRAFRPMFCGKDRLTAWATFPEGGGPGAIHAWVYDLENPRLWKDVFGATSDGWEPTWIHLNRSTSVVSMGYLGQDNGGKQALYAVWRRADQKRLSAGEALVRTISPDQSGAVSIDGANLFVAARNEIQIHSLAEQNIKQTGSLKGRTGEISCMHVSANGNLLAAGTLAPANSVRVWSIATPDSDPRHFPGHTGRINAVQFSEDALRLLSASEDETVRVWNVKTGDMLYEVSKQGQPVIDACFTPGGRRCVFQLADGTIQLWQLPK